MISLTFWVPFLFGSFLLGHLEILHQFKYTDLLSFPQTLSSSPLVGDQFTCAAPIICDQGQARPITFLRLYFPGINVTNWRPMALVRPGNMFI